MSSDRRDFLGTLRALGAAPMLTGAAHRESDPTPLKSEFDVTWAGKLSGKRRAVFDCVEISMRLGLLRALVWQKDNADVYGTKPSGLSPVVVLRHNAIWQAMNDEFWAHHKIGELTIKLQPSGVFATLRAQEAGCNYLLATDAYA